MSDDHIDRAAEIIYVEVLGLPDYSPDAVDDHNRHSYRGDCDCNHNDRVDARHAAEELDAAGLLASPEHDAAVAARAADLTLSVIVDDLTKYAPEDPGTWWGATRFVRRYVSGAAIYERADRIEAGGHDA